MEKGFKTMRDFLTTINIYDYEKFRGRIIEECNISTATWSNWRRGAVEPEKKYKAIIDKIATEMFGAPIYNQEGGQQ